MATHFHVVFFCLVISLGAVPAQAAPLQDGRLSEIVRDVRVAESGKQPVRVTGDLGVQDGSIQTGPESRAQVTFQDQSVVRLGDNSQLTIESKSRTYELTSGAILTQVPSGVGRTTVRVGDITATATGTTLVIERVPQSYAKFISLDGTSRLCLGHAAWNQDCVLLRAGQMLIAGPASKSLPDAVDVDLRHLLETCQFITAFPELPAKNRLTKAAAAQSKRKSYGKFAETNLVIFGRGTLVSQQNSNSIASKEPGTGPAKPSPSATSH